MKNIINIIIKIINDLKKYNNKIDKYLKLKIDV